MSEINSFYRRPWRSLGSSLNEPVWWKALTECLANVNRQITDDRGTANSERPCQKKKKKKTYCRSSCALSYVPFLVGLSLWQLIWILNNWSEIDVLYGCNSSHSLRWCLFCALMCSLRYVYAQNSKQIILSHHLLRKYPLEGIQGGGCANDWIIQTIINGNVFCYAQKMPSCLNTENITTRTEISQSLYIHACTPTPTDKGG